MQLKFLFLFLFFTGNAFGYVCKSQRIDESMGESKKSVFKSLKNKDREIIFQGLLFEITKKDLANNPKKARLLAEFLVNTEANQDRRAFIQLLMTTSEIETENAHPLNLNEICELNERLNKLYP